MRNYVRLAAVTMLAIVGSLAPVTASATPAEPATCVGHASAFFGGEGVRDDIAHAIKAAFGIPPGDEVSRFAHVFLGSAELCIQEGQA